MRLGQASVHRPSLASAVAKNLVRRETIQQLSATVPRVPLEDFPLALVPSSQLSVDGSHKMSPIARGKRQRKALTGASRLLYLPLRYWQLSLLYITL